MRIRSTTVFAWFAYNVNFRGGEVVCKQPLIVSSLSSGTSKILWINWIACMFPATRQRTLYIHNVLSLYFLIIHTRHNTLIISKLSPYKREQEKGSQHGPNSEICKTDGRVARENIGVCVSTAYYKFSWSENLSAKFYWSCSKLLDNFADLPSNKGFFLKANCSKVGR